MISIYDDTGERIGSFDSSKAIAWPSADDGTLYFTASDTWVWALTTHNPVYAATEEARDWLVTTNNAHTLHSYPEAARSLGLYSYLSEETDGKIVDNVIMQVFATTRQRAAYRAEADEQGVPLDAWITSTLDSQLTVAGNVWTYLDEDGVEIVWPGILAQ